MSAALCMQACIIVHCIFYVVLSLLRYCPHVVAGGASEAASVAVGSAGISAANLIGKDPNFEAELTSFMSEWQLS